MNITTSIQGRTLEQFQRLLQLRTKWLKESSKDATAAIMLDVLRSLRAVTKIANPKKDNIQMKEMSNWIPSFRFAGGWRLCARDKGTKKHIDNVRLHSTNNDKITNQKIFHYKTFNGKDVYVMAHNLNEAMKWARNKAINRAEQHKGLARLALTMLRGFVQTIGPVHHNQPIETKKKVNNSNLISKEENIFESEGQMRYQLVLSDKLDYASLALKNGALDVDTATKRALNSATKRLEIKCPSLLLFEDLSTPFPEVHRGKR